MFGTPSKPTKFLRYKLKNSLELKQQNDWSVNQKGIYGMNKLINLNRPLDSMTSPLN